jgi:hypothetical protein
MRLKRLAKLFGGKNNARPAKNQLCLVKKLIIGTQITSKLIAIVGLLTFFSACESTAPQLGADASA